jgi:hypothetical protein
MKIRNLAAVLLLGFATTGFAVPITLTSEWSSRWHGDGTLIFTYDDETPDSNPDPQHGNYLGAILALEFVFDDFVYQLDTSAANEIHVRAPFETPSGGSNMHVNGWVIGADLQQYQLSLGIENYALAYVGTDAINEIIGRGNDDSTSSWIGLPGMNPGLSNLLMMKTPFTQVTAVPESGAAGLLAAGLLGLLLRRRFRGAVRA